MEIEQSVDFHLYIILSDDILAVEVIDLFAEVNPVGIDIASARHCHQRLSMVYEGDDDIDAWLKGLVIASKAFDNLSFRLWDDDDSLLQDDCCQHYDDNKEDSDKFHNYTIFCGLIYCFTFKMMLSLDTTVTTVPTGMSSAASETERHSSPSILTYPLPPAGMVSMTLPCLPIKASALLLRVYQTIGLA